VIDDCGSGGRFPACATASSRDLAAPSCAPCDSVAMRAKGHKVTVLWRLGLTKPSDPSAPEVRYRALLDALSAEGLDVTGLAFAEEEADATREALSSNDAVLVWVDPIAAGRDRSILDRVLRDVASQGVLVHAHPDTILKMGTKDVLYDTRSLGGASTRTATAISPR